MKKSIPFAAAAASLALLAAGCAGTHAVKKADAPVAAAAPAPAPAPAPVEASRSVDM